MMMVVVVVGRVVVVAAGQEEEVSLLTTLSWTGSFVRAKRLVFVATCFVKSLPHGALGPGHLLPHHHHHLLDYVSSSESVTSEAVVRHRHDDPRPRHVYGGIVWLSPCSGRV